LSRRIFVRDVKDLKKVSYTRRKAMVPEDSVVSEYIRTHPKSQKLHERALNHFAADGATHIGRVSEPTQPYLTHAKGCRKWDVDGNEYIDYVLAHGALIQGHNHPDVVKAIQEQATKSVHLGGNHEMEVELAELIKKMMPSVERVELFSCGNEANIMAIRLARVFTSRKKILRFEGHFHGWADELSPHHTPGVFNDQVSFIPMNDLNIVEKELSTREYAILMTEGGGAGMGGMVPLNHDFVKDLRFLTSKYGTVWHIDEVVTGFRDAPGGWQSTVGITPDLTTLGKCLGGGLGIGAIVGRADIMAAFSPRHPEHQRIAHSGTWNANPLTVAASIAACKLFQSGEIQQKAAQMATYLRREGNKVIKERGISARLYSRSISHLYFGPIDYEPTDDTLPPTKDMQKIFRKASTPVRSRLSLLLMQRGIHTPLGRMFILSAAHSKEDVDQTVKTFAESLDVMIAEGSLGKTNEAE
jgi:glutamate-1-semialdehyde 2,1-aminomutase